MSWETCTWNIKKELREQRNMILLDIDYKGQDHAQWRALVLPLMNLLILVHYS